MKCAACGYEGGFEWVGFSGIMELKFNSPSVFKRYKELYSCPKCGTVKVEEDKSE